MTSLMKQHFCIDMDHWLEIPNAAEREWQDLPLHLHRPFFPVVDAVRHVLDPFPKATRPLDLPGLIPLDRPDRYCGDLSFTAWLMLFDELFLNTQFFATIGKNCKKALWNRTVFSIISVCSSLWKAFFSTVPSHGAG